MAIYKGFIFDGISSLDYGIYITGEAVYNAPERDVEMISIPGRNGEFALDNGRFNNISVTYRAGAFGQDQPDFAGKIDAFRNALASRVGYCRITDGYNPDEYRMAIYKSGLEVSPVAISKAGEFDIVFDCKPQRFLLSGETKQTVTSGQELTNPTLFESHPLLEVRGYGAINLGDESVVAHNDPIGPVTRPTTITESIDLNARTMAFTMKIDDTSMFANGDRITIKALRVTAIMNNRIDSAQFTNKERLSSVQYAVNTLSIITYEYYVPKGQTLSGTAGVDMTLTKDGVTETGRIVANIEWDGNDTFTYAFQFPSYSFLEYRQMSGGFTSSKVTGNSTKPSVGDPLYIDLDIGEAYKIEGTVIPINSAVEIPAELPTLKAGANTITFDNTITQLDITPRWWKI